MSVANAQQVADSLWVERLGRAGLVAKAAMYGIIGALALAIPLGLGGKATDRHGALRTVAEQPCGEVLVALARWLSSRTATSASGRSRRVSSPTPSTVSSRRATATCESALRKFRRFLRVPIASFSD